MEVVDEVLDLGSWHDVRCERGGERRAASGVEARFFAELFVLRVSDERRKTKVIAFDASLKKREAVVQQKFPALFLSTALENPVLSRATSLVGTFSRASKWNHRESAVFSDLRIVSLDIRRNESRAQGARHTPPFLHLPPKPFFSWRNAPDSLFASHKKGGSNP